MKKVFFPLLVGLVFFAAGCIVVPCGIPKNANTTVPAPSTAIPQSAATTPANRLNIGWWKTRLANKEGLATRHYDTVLIGDSITHNWDNIAPDLQKQYFGDALNLGFSGDRTQDVLWRIARIDWETVSPKRIMLMIGTNNTGWRPPETAENTFYGIKSIIQVLRKECPDTKITLLAIFPRGVNPGNDWRKANDAINVRLQELADEEHVYLRDISPYYFLPDGKTLNQGLLPDQLHPNKEGHRIWAAATARDFMRDYR
ncbi:MAG: GDSL-type esterase/lipase family protein [Kiritimatiellia bacterium]